MNPDKHQKPAGLPRYNPFAICFVVLLLLTGDYALRLVNLVNQREQLNRAAALQAQNAGTLAQGRELETRLEAFSIELLQIAKTNTTASNIIREFNIQWTPSSAAPAPAVPRAAAPPGATNR